MKFSRCQSASKARQHKCFADWLLYLIRFADNRLSCCACSRPVAYDISLSQLDASYKALQKSLHPDRFQLDQARAQHETASTLSAFVNDAYTTLKQPYERALYLVSCATVMPLRMNG